MRNVAIVSVLLLVLAMAILGPIAAIWSVNTLFKLQIAYGFEEWLAALILMQLLTKYITIDRK